jgi:hypothetical protein
MMGQKNWPTEAKMGKMERDGNGIGSNSPMGKRWVKIFIWLSLSING